MAAQDPNGSPVVLKLPALKFAAKQGVSRKRPSENDSVEEFGKKVEPQWGDKKEQILTTWLNKVLTPPIDIDLDNDAPPRLMGKKEIVAAMKQVAAGETIDAPSVPTKEEASLQTYVSRRWMAKLRSQASNIYVALESVLSKLDEAIDIEKVMVRKDRCVCSNVGLQKFLLDALHSVYPIWLRIGLETVYGMEIDQIKSNKDVTGLTAFIMERMFNDPDLRKQFGFTGIIHYHKAEYASAMAKFFIKKFFRLFIFLDAAKTARLIKHDPCLFYSKSVYKSAKDVFTSFTTEALSGDGNLFKLLTQIGYQFTYHQAYVDEVRYFVKDTMVDLRDGVILCRVVELLTDDYSLLSKLRCPPISILQKVHNVNVALNALDAQNVQTKDIPAKKIVEGHREITLTLVDRMMKRFYNIRIGDGVEQLAKIFTKLQARCKGFVFRRMFAEKRQEDETENDCGLNTSASQSAKQNDTASALEPEQTGDVEVDEEISSGEVSVSDEEESDFERLFDSVPSSNVFESPDYQGVEADLGSPDPTAMWSMVDNSYEATPVVQQSVSKLSEHYCRWKADEWHVPASVEYPPENADMASLPRLEYSPARRPKLDVATENGGSDGRQSSSMTSSCSSFSPSQFVAPDEPRSEELNGEQLNMEPALDTLTPVSSIADATFTVGHASNRDFVHGTNANFGSSDVQAAGVGAEQVVADNGDEEVTPRTALADMFAALTVTVKNEQVEDNIQLDSDPIHLQREFSEELANADARRENAAAVICKWWRMILARRREKAVMAEQEARREKASATIGKWWRRILQRRREQAIIAEEAARKRKAVKAIAAWWGRILQQKALNKAIAEENAKRENAARVLQGWWQRILLRRRLREMVTVNQLRKKNAVKRIQRWWKMVSVRRQEQKAIAERRQKAATKIQSAWRGYRFRQNPNNFPAVVQDLCRRIAVANNDATEQKTVATRTRNGLHYLLACQKLSEIRRGLMELDAVTRLSATSCNDLVASGAVSVLFKLIHEMNQSEASREITAFSVSVLFNLAKFDKTRAAICAFPNWFSELVGVMYKFRHGSREEVFVRVAMILVILSELDEATPEISGSESTFKKLRDMNNELQRQEKRRQNEEKAKKLQQRGKADVMLHKQQHQPVSFWKAAPVRFKPEWDLSKDKPNENLDRDAAVAWVAFTFAAKLAAI